MLFKEWQWIHHDGGGEMSNKLKVPIRLMKIHTSVIVNVKMREIIEKLLKMWNFLSFFLFVACYFHCSRRRVDMLREIHQYRNHIHLAGMAVQMRHSCVMIQLHRVKVRVLDYTSKTHRQAQHGGFHHRAVGEFTFAKCQMQ